MNIFFLVFVKQTRWVTWKIDATLIKSFIKFDFLTFNDVAVFGSRINLNSFINLFTFLPTKPLFITNECGARFNSSDSSLLVFFLVCFIGMVI